MQLLLDGYYVEAEAVQRLLLSRVSSTSLNKVLHTDLARLRALLSRAHDALTRAQTGDITDAEWDQLRKDIAAEVGVAA